MTDDSDRADINPTEPGSTEQASSQEREPVSVSAFLAMCLTELNMLAWTYMGLIRDPVSGKELKDLEQARLAVDAFEAVTKVAKRTMSEKEAREMERALADLKMNYVQQSTSS